MIRASILTEIHEKIQKKFLGFYNEPPSLENFGSSFLLTERASYQNLELADIYRLVCFAAMGDLRNILNF